MVGWHQQLKGHEFEQTQEDSEGQGSLVCCSPWGRKEPDTTQQPNNEKQQQTTDNTTDQTPGFLEECGQSLQRGAKVS